MKCVLMCEYSCLVYVIPSSKYETVYELILIPLSHAFGIDIVVYVLHVKVFHSQTDFMYKKVFC